MEKMWPLRRLSVWDEATRRGAVRLLGGGGMAALLGRFAAGAEAKKNHKKNKKKKKKATCNTSGGQFATQFSLSRSQAATAGNCLAAASGTVKIFQLGFAERMEVSLTGLPANTEFDLFVIQVPNAPFGVSWYQGDLTTDSKGNATECFVGRFNVETFVVSPGVAAPPQVHTSPPFPDAVAGITTAPIHTFHIGVWFNSTTDAANAGCPNTATPFNGDHTAGIQALASNTFPDDQGPLRGIGS
jgi:hypothetical protein